MSESKRKEKGDHFEERRLKRKASSLYMESEKTEKGSSALIAK